MTNEQAKQEAIKKAYGNHYSICKPAPDGWGEAINIDTDKYDVRGGYGLRPKSLRGIEDNNGWIRIEPDGSNLPKAKEWVLCYHPNPEKGSHYGNNQAILYFNSDSIDDEWSGWMHQNGYAQAPTHYKTPELKPIY